MRIDLKRSLPVLRVITGLGLVMGGILVFVRATGGPAIHGLGWGLIGCALALTGSIVLAPPMARLLAHPLGSIFYPGAEFDQPQPMYSIAEGQMKRGANREAYASYEELAARYPGELKPYLGMIELAEVFLGEPETARSVYELGRSLLKTEEDRATLKRLYLAHQSRTSKRPAWSQGHTVQLPQDSPGAPSS